jgi:CheY-like chemotaxis protein
MATVSEVDLLKRQFLAALNHEVRTPLSGILGMTNLLEQTPLNAEQQEYLALQKACVEELYQVLSATLEFTALAAGETRIECGDFLLQESLESVAAQWLLKARQKGLGFRFSIDDEVPEAARGDEIRLRQIVTHLLSNAVKFTSEGEIGMEVKVRDTSGIASRPGRFWLEIAVRDTGIGISEDQRRRIFESFEQLDSGLARRYQGLGLGLSLAQGFCRVMGGELYVESEAGKGSCFTVAIPLEASGLQLPSAAPVMPAKESILVVDDNDAARKVALAFLKRGGYPVAVAANAAEGLDLAAKHHYSLVLMDLQMPDLDGIEATRRLREIPGYQHVPVIALTANAGEEYRELCQRNGFEGFLPKPVESELLLRTVRQELQKAAR